MLQNNPELPPVIQVLIGEDLRGLSDPETADRVLKRGLLGDLKRQASWTFDHFVYPDHEEHAPSSRFIVTPSGALNPLAWSGPCDEAPCRIRRAKTFVRTLGVWAEEIYLPDVFSHELLNPGRPSKRWLERFSNDIAVLRELLPLIRAGIVRFGNVAFAVCGQCRSVATQAAATDLTRELRGEFSFRSSWRPGYLLAEAPAVLGEMQIHFRIPVKERAVAADLLRTQNRKRLSAAASRLRGALISQCLGDRLADVLLDLHSAQQLKSLVISGSRTDVLCIKTLEEEMPELANIEEWEQPREVQIPWIANLTASEVVQLRELAAEALPRFRELVAAGVAGPAGEGTKAPAVLAAELRAQAAEVEAELKAVQPRTRRRDRTTVAIVSAGVALYGLAAAAGIPNVASAGPLISALGLIHGFARNDHAEETRIRSRPGYVLLKARELLDARGHRQHVG